MRVVRDVIATLIVATMAVLYLNVVGGSGVWFIADARGVAATGLVSAWSRAPSRASR